jgi:4-hydroxy-2-oxoheptanedioate aldolase
MRPNRLRQIWAEGRAAVNGWLALPDAFAAEVMAQQGWDSLTIDLQHGLAGDAMLVPMLQAISTTPTVPLVRVPWLEPGALMKALDAGAYGLICPMVNTADDAAKLVHCTRYAPEGGRSFGPVRGAMYAGVEPAAYAKAANATIVAFAMIETAQALDNLDAILAVEGLEAIYVGPSDLALTLGCSPNFDDPEPRAAQAIAHIVERAQAHGKIAGIHNGRTEVAKARIAMGYRFVTIGSDARLLAAGSQQILAGMR